MQFVDQVEIVVKAGDGGDGVVAFRREKYIPRGGPDGGNGGKGGSVIVQGVGRLNTLVDLRYKRHYKAERGSNGGGNNKSGKDGRNLTIRVPIGTVITNAETGRVIADITKDGQKVTVAKGGSGGRGNASFASSTNQTPRYAEKGEPTEEMQLKLELKLLADVGLIGFPSVGKSTLISRISSAKPKIADYPFTTLVPNLGVVMVDDKSFVVADMPGLIEGAHLGAGLGIQFLRHIERTRLLVHILDVSGYSTRDPLQDFDIINEELREHNERLATLPQVVALNKTDMPEARDIVDLVKPELEGRGYEVHEISALAGLGLQQLLYSVADKLDQIPRPELEPAEEVMRFTVEPEEADWEVIKTSEHEFEVTGRSVEVIVKRTDINNEYALRRMHRQLDKMGVIGDLRKLGAEHGDSVIIAGLEFDFHDEAYE